MEDITNKMADMQMGAVGVKSPHRRQAQPMQVDKENQHQAAPQAARRKIWSYEDFDVGPPIGEGKFGRVHPARVKGLNLVYAMKVMRLDQLSPKQLKRELSIHRSLRHKHIVRLVTWFTDEACAYLIMEWCNGGTLHEKMCRYGNDGFPQEMAAKYTAQLCEALVYMHSQTPAVLHRDIKPENTFLDSNGDLKLGDFGWSVALRNNTPRMTVCGTFDYFAPEMCSRSTYDTGCDMWSVGVFAFEMCFGHPPFAAAQEGAPEEELFQKIRKEKLQFPCDVSVDLSAKDFISRLLEKAPANRMSLTDV